MALRSGDKAPYAPPATVLDIISKFRDRGLATPFTAEVLARAGVPESLVQRTLATLVGLDLVDNDGAPTDTMEALRRVPTPEYKATFAGVVKSVYAEVFQFVDPATASLDEVSDAFRAYEPAGQRRRMVTLFLGLCDAAGLLPDEAPARASTKTQQTRSPRLSPRKPPPGVGARKRPRLGPENLKGPGFAVGRVNLSTDADEWLPPAINGLLASIPPATKGWTPDARKRWLDTFVAVLDFSIPIREASQDDGTGADDEGEDS